MRFLNEKPDHDLTYNDVFMAPNRSAVTSRMRVDLTSNDGIGNPLPLGVANMTAVSGRRMAETAARRGGVAVFPQDIPVGMVKKAMSRIKDAPTMFENPVTLAPDNTVGEALALIPKRAHGVGVVLDAGRPVGLVGMLEAENVERFAQAHEVMTRPLYTSPSPLKRTHTRMPSSA